MNVMALHNSDMNTVSGGQQGSILRNFPGAQHIRLFDCEDVIHYIQQGLKRRTDGVAFADRRVSVGDLLKHLGIRDEALTGNHKPIEQQLLVIPFWGEPKFRCYVLARRRAHVRIVFSIPAFRYPSAARRAIMPRASLMRPSRSAALMRSLSSRFSPSAAERRMASTQSAPSSPLRPGRGGGGRTGLLLFAAFSGKSPHYVVTGVRVVSLAQVESGVYGRPGTGPLSKGGILR